MWMQPSKDKHGSAWGKNTNPSYYYCGSGPSLAAPCILITSSPKRDEGLNEIIAIQWTQISRATPWQTAWMEREGERAWRNIGGGIGRCMFWCAFHGLQGPLSEVGFILNLRG